MDIGGLLLLAAAIPTNAFRCSLADLAGGGPCGSALFP